MLILIRGLPGSGKSTMAGRYSTNVFEADDYFVGADGVYRFDPKQLSKAHAACLQRTEDALLHAGYAVVANTFSQRWEMEPYLQLAKAMHTPVLVLEVQTALTDAQLAARNVHGVPERTIAAMRARWETDWEAGDPRPPWQRK